MTKTTERTTEDIYAYYKKALDSLEVRFKGKRDHPNYKELRMLLIDQVNDELNDCTTNTFTNRRAS